MSFPFTTTITFWCKLSKRTSIYSKVSSSKLFSPIFFLHYEFVATVNSINTIPYSVRRTYVWMNVSNFDLKFMNHINASSNGNFKSVSVLNDFLLSNERTLHHGKFFSNSFHLMFDFLQSRDYRFYQFDFNQNET